MILRGYCGAGMLTWGLAGSFTPIMLIFCRGGAQCKLMLYNLTWSPVSMRSPLFIVQALVIWCFLIPPVESFLFIFLLFMSDLHG